MPVTDEIEIYKRVKSGLRIADATDDEIKNTLKGIYFLIGLSVTQIMSHTEEHKAAFVAYIREGYSVRTLQEFELAFKMYARGEFGENEKNINFSPKFISFVMNKYAVWSQRQFEQVIGEQKDQQALLPSPKPADWHELSYSDWLYEEFLAGRLNATKAWQISSTSFDALLDSGILEVNDKITVHYYTKAKNHLLIKWKDELKTLDWNKHLGQIKELQGKIEILNKPLDEAQMLPEMQRYAKAFYVLDFFDKCQKKKVEKISDLKK